MRNFCHDNVLCDTLVSVYTITMIERHSFKVAVFVFLMKDGKTFILRRANTGWADGMWTLPSGHVEKGESVYEAAIKETREEAGVIIKAENLEFVHAHAVGDVYINFYFKTSVWEGEPYLAEREKCSDVTWVPLNLLPNDTIMHVREVVNRMNEGAYFSEIENDPNPS